MGVSIWEGEFENLRGGVEPSLEREDLTGDLTQARPLRAPDFVHWQPVEERKHFHVSPRHQGAPFVAEQRGGFAKFLACQQVMDVLNGLLRRIVVVRVPRDAASVQVLPLLGVQAAQKEFANQVVHVNRVRVGLPCKPLLHQRFQNVEVQVLLPERIERHRFAVHGDGREDTLLLSAQLCKNFHAHVRFKRFVVRVSVRPAVDQFQHERMAPREAMDVEPLLVREVFKSAQKLAGGFGFESVQRQHERANTPLSVLRCNDRLVGAGKQDEPHQVIGVNQVQRDPLHHVVKGGVGDLVVVVQDDQGRGSSQRIHNQTGRIGRLWDRRRSQIIGKGRITDVRQPFCDGLKEGACTFPILTAMVQDVPTVRELLDKFRSDRRLPDAGDARDEQRRGTCVEEVDNVVKFSLTAVEAAEARQVGHGAHKLLLNVLRQVPIDQIRGQSTKVQHTVVVHVSNDVNRAHRKGEDLVYAAEVGTFGAPIGQDAMHRMGTKPKPCLFRQSDAPVGEEIRLALSRDA